MSSVNDGFEEVRGGLLLLELSMCCCMSMPHSQKAEALTRTIGTDPQRDSPLLYTKPAPAPPPI